MVSIAMTTFNGEKYIGLQIDSILNQTYKDIELIICDDLSTDSTREILLDYKKKDPRCKIFFNEVNLGFKKNFEKAISLCSGEYIALSDQDDVWELWKIEETLKILDDKQFVCTNASLIDESGNFLGYTMKEVTQYHWMPLDSNSLFKRLVHGNFVQGSTILARASFLKTSIPIPLIMPFHDWWFAICACFSNGFAYSKKNAIRYRQHTSQVTENKKKTFINELKATNQDDMTCKKKLSDFEMHVKLCDYLLAYSSLSETQTQFLKESRRYFSEMQSKTFYTFLYFAKYCKYISLDKNIFRNTIRIIKRFLGYFRFKLYKKVA
mgnify:CR=1 FL=1